VKEIRAFARYSAPWRWATEQDAVLSHAFHDLRELKVESLPVLLELYHDYANHILSAADFAPQQCCSVEAYVFRRGHLTPFPANSMNKTLRHLRQNAQEGIATSRHSCAFPHAASYRRFPSDDEFRRRPAHPRSVPLRSSR